MKTVVLDFFASLSLLTRCVQGGIAMVASVAMAVMVGDFPRSYSQVLGAPGIPIEDEHREKWGIKIPWEKECFCNHCFAKC